MNLLVEDGDTSVVKDLLFIIKLDMHFTWELDFHGNGDDIEVILIYLNLLLIVGH